MNWYNTPKFDYDTGSLAGLWDPETEVDFFVDSLNGDDSNSGTYDPGTGLISPKKTMQGVKALGAGSWAADKVIMVAGYVSGDMQFNVAVRVVGVSGINGRCIFLSSGAEATSPRFSIAGIKFDNIIWVNYNHSFRINYYHNIFYTFNCIFNNTALSGHFDNYLYFYYSIFSNVKYDGYRANTKLIVAGNNNTFYNNSTITGISPNGMGISGNNNHINNDLVFTGEISGQNNLLDIDGEYIDPENLNFGITEESPLYRAGTLDVFSGLKKHVGAGTLQLKLTGENKELKETGDGNGTATYTNITRDGSSLYRTLDGIDGNIESGYIDLGGMKTNFNISLRNSVDTDGSGFRKNINSNNPLTDKRMGFSIGVKFGITKAEVDSCDWLLMEWGYRPLSYSVNSGVLKGNADPDFNPNNENYVTAKYIKIKPNFTNIY